MSATTRSAVAAIVAGGLAALLSWPTSSCRSTLMLAPPGQPDPNTRACVSVIGLPSTTVAAVVLSLLVAAVVYALVRRR